MNSEIIMGERLAELRKAHNLSQVALSKLLDVSKQSVSNWENNNIKPSIEMTKKICQVLSCSSDYLLGLTNTSSNTLDVSLLSVKQIAHLELLINDFVELNKKIHKLEK